MQKVAACSVDEGRLPLPCPLAHPYLTNYLKQRIGGAARAEALAISPVLTAAALALPCSWQRAAVRKHRTPTSPLQPHSIG